MIRDTIRDAVASITDTCREEAVFSAGDETALMPNRWIIINIIKDLRRVVFPGYFGNENITSTMPQYFLGNMMTEVYEALKGQIETAFYFQDRRCSGDNCRSSEELSRQAAGISEAFIGRLPDIQKMLLMDVQAGYDGDPASQSKENIIFSYPGLFAIFVYRLAHELYIRDVPYIPRIMTEYAHGKTGIDINAGATIGKYFFIDHGTGIVVGETTEIGDYVKLYQGVTLGALSTRKGQDLAGVKRHPTIEDRVTIYAGSTILGGETVIGHDSVIGGNTFITQSIPAHSRVSFTAPELAIGSSRDEDSPWD